ncbi:sigma-70 family RNA polymerase sigma factor [Oscillospiraceae bacterium CM]|nr:sigma-70 family RNA polymerase sigma factor [Oscillospiraceae bacterium CM]
MTHAEEQAVIHKVLDGDTDAFEVLVLEHQKKIFHLALKMTVNEDDALDIAQEAFVKAFTGLASFRGDCRFSVWLYRLTYHLCIDFIRKRQRMPVRSLTVVDDIGELADMEISDMRYEPARAAEERAVQRAVADGMMSLPESHREILMMRELAGLRYDEIARALGIGEGTVKSRLSRARQRLAAYLVKNGTFSNEDRHNTEKTGKEAKGRG